MQYFSSLAKCLSISLAVFQGCLGACLGLALGNPLQYVFVSLLVTGLSRKQVRKRGEVYQKYGNLIPKSVILIMVIVTNIY